MKPDWDKLANEFKKSSSLVVADVDCTADGKSLCEEFSVSGYPTIKTIRNGDKKQVEDYDGGRGLSALRKHAESLKPPMSLTDRLKDPMNIVMALCSLVVVWIFGQVMHLW